MRELILKNRWQSKGAQFGSLGGVQCVKNFGDVKKELFAIRNSAALCDFSFVKKFEFDEGDGIDFLDSILAANILKLRYGKIVDTFLADESGKIAAETFVANIDDKIILAAEQAGDASLSPISEKSQNVRDITDSHVLLSVDGPLAWKVAREIFGADILNLPFLSIEKYDFEGESVYLLRNGKTGEFGYQFLAPSSAAESLSAKIEASLETLGGCVCGFDAHKIARMEGNFFNIYGEGLKVECPLELGLQWMVDFDKESFVGSKSIFQKRENGLARRLVGLQSAGEIKEDCDIFDGDLPIGKVVSAARSHTLEKYLALAVFDQNYALSGFDFSTAPNAETTVSTISRPPIVAESLKKGMEE